MIDDFLTCPDDLPPVRPRRVARAEPGRTDLVSSPAPSTAYASRAALAAGMLLAASVAGTPPVTDAPPGPGTGASASRTP